MAEAPGTSPGPGIPSKRAKVGIDPAAPDTDGEPTPPAFVRKLRKAAVGTGCDIRLRVSVAGRPAPLLTWYHNEEPLAPTDSQDAGGLWIRDCHTGDAGLYTCVATNALGETSTSAVLAVMDLGDDSETTEDEATEPQVPMESKDGPPRPLDRAGRRGAPGEGVGGRAADFPADGSARRSPLPGGGYDPVVERELMALGSRPLGSHHHNHNHHHHHHHDTANHPARIQTAVDDESKRLSSPSPDVFPPFSAPPPSDNNGLALRSAQGEVAKAATTADDAKADQASGVGVAMTPKLARAAPKIFDKVLSFEEKAGGADCGPESRSSRPRFGRAASCDADTSTTGPTKEDGRVLRDAAAQRRSAFKQRASSLEDQTDNYAQKVQTFQNKFTEELQRIKRLVGKPNLKKAYSTEQLPQRELPRLGKVEPIPPQVVRKLEARERALEERGARDEDDRGLLAGERDGRRGGRTPPPPQPAALTKASADSSTAPHRAGNVSVTMETAPVKQLPGRPLPTAGRRSPNREALQNSPSTEPPSPSPSPSPGTVGPTSSARDPEPPRPPTPSKTGPTKTADRTDTRSPSPGGGGGPSKQPWGTPCPTRPPRLTPSPTPQPPRLTPSPTPPPMASASPLQKRRRAERAASPALKLTIPTILVEDQPMEEEEEEKEGERRRSKPGGARKEAGRGRKGKRERGQPRSPEEGGSSDDSYLSADEAEAPVIERPLQDIKAPAGSEVTLTCSITGSPLPTVTWRKGGVEIRSDARHAVRAQGETHRLVIRQAGRGDEGTYTVTAGNPAGRAASSATLFIKTEPTPTQRGVPTLSPEVSSPIQSDEEYLSPLEEVMEVGDTPTPRPATPSKQVHFREPPTFQVTPTDQGVAEGQEVTLSAKVRGLPRPMVSWTKDKVALKSGGRLAVCDAEDGGSEVRISGAQRSDAGVYVCKIINEYGTKTSECHVEVRAPQAQTALSVVRELRDVAVKAGECAMFECHMTGPADIDVDWLSSGKLIQPALLNCKMHFDGKRCRLLLNSVHEDDSGTYTCKLSTAKEELTSSGNLKVAPSREPLFTRKLDILEVIEGRTARFNCKVSGLPAPRVTWMHFETPVELDDENVQVLQDGGRHSLVIAHVSSDTEGFYTAVAENAHGKSECTAELYMQEPRAAISSHMAKLEKMPSIPEEPEVLESDVEKRTMPDFVKPLADVEVIEGKEAVLSCKVAGLPYPSIAWYHNGKHIDSTEERKMTQYRDVHSLVIRSACHAHGGVYKSVIANKTGKAACYAHLYVTDIVPDPPDGPPVVESVTGKTLTLSWKRPKRHDPSFDSSSLLYAVQQQALGSIQWTVIASNLKEPTYIVTSLSKGVRYAFRVLTSTGKAFSRPSPPTDLVQLVDKGPFLRKAPVIVDKPDVVFVIENQPVSITITLNHVHAVVAWKRRGVVLVNRPGMYEMSMPDDDQHTLRLQRVRSSDVGHLTVTANNQFGADLCTLRLAVAVPPKFESIMEDLDVDVGDTSRLAVVVEGKPDPDILWFKDDVLLSESSQFTFVYDEAECSLVVLNARAEDSGVYTCTAKNVAGAVSCKAELTVHTERKQAVEPMEDEGTILRKMRRLSDYYDIHKEIGRGAFSYVKRVTQKKGKAEFGAKFICARGKRKALALREMGLLSDLDHAAILYFHDAFEKKNVVVLITELCHEELLERMGKKTSVQESEIRSSIQQVLEGLCYLHQKDIVHLDVKPENILMTSPLSDRIRICDFGNAAKLEADAHYCRYGTPEYVAPEIVNQTPVSKATDIWPVGVITYLCLTGVSPFAGENDRATVLNIRSYNVAFEENMFSDLCKEAKGFVIKLLMVDSLRPNAVECLRHPWFKSSTSKSINTAMLKQVLSRRKWQRSLISYKSKMVMRTIPELLDDSTNHISIAVGRHLKEGSPPPSSSSDSDEDVDELPFIPMPLSMVFSGSRVSLNEIPGEDDASGRSNGSGEWTRKAEDMEVTEEGGGTGKRTTEEGGESTDEEKGATRRGPLKKGSSVEDEEESQAKARRATMRRGSSADSALLLHIDGEEGDAKEDPAAPSKSLKKSVSMELPNRSPSPGPVKLNQEDYALKLELMRQRLLRGGSADKKMSGLRGPLFETLGMDDERRTGSLDRNLRRSRVGPPTLTRAASSEGTGEETLKTKVFRKSTSFGDSEPMPLHRRFGAPLEIPSAVHVSVEDSKLQEATSMSALTEQTRLDSQPASPTGSTSFILPVPERVVDQRQERKDEKEEPETRESVDEENAERDEVTERRTNGSSESEDEVESGRSHSQERSPSVLAPTIVIEEDYKEMEELNESQEIVKEVKTDEESAESKPSSAYASVMQAIVVPNGKSDINHPIGPPATTKATPKETKARDSPTLPEHPAVFAQVATTSTVPDRPTTPRQPVLRTDIKDIDSQEVFEARFKKRESSLTRGLRKLTRTKSDDKSPVLGRKAGEGGEEVYRPGARGAPLEMVSKGLQERAKSVQDLREVEKETGLGLIGRFSMRSKRSSSVDTKDEKPKQEKVKEEKPKEVQEASVVKRRVSWAIGRSKSLDTNELDSAGTQKNVEEKEESAVFAMRRKFESKVAGISAKLRTHSEERKDKEAKGDSQKDLEQTDLKKVGDSPVLAMRQRFENKMAEISTKIRSQSEERRAESEAKSEGRRTPLFTRHRHSQSEGRGARGMGIPENQLAKQTGAGASKESIESASSVNSEKVSRTPENDRRSRWDRWGLTRSKKDKTPSQTDLPSSNEEDTSGSQRFLRTSSDFPPVFHIKLRDHVLLEGDPVTLSCLPAGSPHPQIVWVKDKKPLEVDDRMNLISHPDGRQLLMILRTSRKDAGLYECVATNNLGAITSTCTLSLACIPKRPGTPEIPQTYNNTALVLWKPADTQAPCSYTLERKTDRDENWLIIATGVADCYYNVTDLPPGGAFRFRVACVNKAGQGPYSSWSARISLDSSVGGASPPVAIVKTVPSPPAPTVSSSITIPPLRLVQTQPPAKTVTTISSSSSPRETGGPPAPKETGPPIPKEAMPTPPSSSPTSKTPPSLPANAVTQEVPKTNPPPVAVKPHPPFVLPKPQSPINVVPPMTQSPPPLSLSPPPPLVTPPPTLAKPALASVPTYAPAATARVAPTPVVVAPSFSPQVLQVASLSPIVEGSSTPTPTRATPSGSGRTTPSSSSKATSATLRQAVPQKPYTFLDEKARGRFGVVRECRENSTGNIYMAKIIPYDQASKPSILKEYEILKSLHSDKVMGLREAYVTPRYLVLVAEYCTGKELLYSLVDRFRYSEDEVVMYLVQILQGLEYLHNRRVLHLDIRPDNIMVTNLNVVKIVDFGNAQSFNPLSLRQYDSDLGILEYMAPEMVKGDLVGPPADIWGLGIVTYIMLSGRLPYQDKDPQRTEANIQMAKFDPTKLYPNVSQSASNFLKKMLSSYAWARPTTKDLFTHAWLQDSYLMKLRRQTLTFTTARLKEFLVEQQGRRTEGATKHKVLLRTYQSSPHTPPTGSAAPHAHPGSM